MNIKIDLSDVNRLPVMAEYTGVVKAIVSDQPIEEIQKLITFSKQRYRESIDFAVAISVLLQACKLEDGKMRGLNYAQRVNLTIFLNMVTGSCIDLSSDLNMVDYNFATTYMMRSMFAMHGRSQIISNTY